MAKRKKIFIPDKDTKITAVVLGSFVIVAIVFFSFSKHKEPHKQAVPIPPAQAVAEVSPPPKIIKPIEQPEVPQPAPEALGNIPGSGGKIAFIIDDWGQSLSNCKYLKEIPEPMAVSILPGLRHTKDVAECAGLYHKLTMLHLPLEALHNFDFYPENYIIKTSMKPALVSKIVDDDLNQLPSIEGVNNHMGSKATGDKSLMTIIFKKIKKRKLFFVDSMTAHNTVCEALAGDMGLAFGKRDVFLDNVNTREAITKQIMVLAQRARRKGYAVAIGHDRHLTMQVLKDEIPLLKSQGFQIVSIKELLNRK